jgi:outer membrane protein W
MIAVLKRSLILWIVLAYSRSAFAQSSETPEYRDWEVSGFVGGSSGSKFQFPTPVSGSDQESFRTVGMRVASSYQLGARVNQYVNDFWAADLEYSVAVQDLTFTNISPSIQSLRLTQFVHHFIYNVSYLPLPRTKQFRPYGDVGIGAVLFYLPGSAKRDAQQLGLKVRPSWEFVFDWGGGFKYLVKDQVALTFDLKDCISRVPSYGIPVSARVVNGQYQPGMSRHGLLQNWQLNVGVAFEWDEWSPYTFKKSVRPVN